MRLIITGLEYSGKTALAQAIVDWIAEAMGEKTGVHDHYWPTISHPPELTDQEQKHLLGLTPRLKELIMRNNNEYHVKNSFYWPSQHDHIVVGLHIEDAVMGPFYYAYGGPDDPQDRRMVSRFLEEEILGKGPDTVLVHVKASPDVIAQRMKDDPHPNSVLREKDIEYLTQRFDEEVEASRLHHKFSVDTDGKSVEETLAGFVEKIEPFLTEVDTRRLLVQAARKKGEWIS